MHQLKIEGETQQYNIICLPIMTEPECDQNLTSQGAIIPSSTSAFTSSDSHLTEKQCTEYMSKETDFYNGLTHFRPVWLFSKQSPIFVLHRSYRNSLPLYLIWNALSCLTMMVRFSVQWRLQLWLLLLLWLGINVLYLFVLLLNPGIQYLGAIDQAQYQSNQKLFCIECNGYRTNEITHCKVCDVCIRRLHHHCPFLGKCIGGRILPFFQLLLGLIAIQQTLLVLTVLTLL